MTEEWTSIAAEQQQLKARVEQLEKQVAALTAIVEQLQSKPHTDLHSI